jgi:hypothetical protein
VALAPQQNAGSDEGDAGNQVEPGSPDGDKFNSAATKRQTSKDKKEREDMACGTCHDAPFPLLYAVGIGV